MQEIDPYEAPYRPLLPVAAYALAASRHMHEFGTTPEQLAAVAVAARATGRGATRGPGRAGRSRSTTSWAPRACATRWACATAAWSPTAAGRSWSSPPSARATLRRPPVLVLGGGEAHGHRHISSMADLTRTAAAESGPRAFAEAGVGPGRRGQRAALRRLHDHADPVPGGPRLLRQGRGRRVRRRAAASRPAARCRSTRTAAASPTATRGCTGCSALVEAVRQRAATSRPTTSSLAHGNGGVLSSQATVVLGSRGDRLGRPSRVAAMDFELTDEQQPHPADGARVHRSRGRPRRGPRTPASTTSTRPRREDRRPGLPGRDRPARVRRRRAWTT